MRLAAEERRATLRDRARGAMLGLAIGDALGATVEFMTPRDIRHAFGVHTSICGGGWLRLKAGEVTDDTTMSSALGDAATICIVDMVQIGLLGGRPQEAIARAEALAATMPVFAWRDRRCESPSGYIVDTFRAVMQAIEARRDFHGVLVDIVNRGGDADTTGAIAGMIVGAQCGNGDLPAPWFGALQDSVRREAIRLADALISLSPAWHVEAESDG